MRMLFSKSRIKRLSKEFSWVVVGQVLAVLGALVLLRVLTERLEPAEFGILALSLTIVTLINIVATQGVMNGIVRYYSVADDQNDVLAYLLSSFKLLSYFSFLILGFGIVAILILVWRGGSEYLALLIAVLLTAITGGFNGCLNGINNAARQRSIVAFHITLEPILKILFVLSAALWFDISATLVLACYALAFIVIMVSQIFFLHRSHDMQGVLSAEASEQDWIKMILIFSWPMMIWGIFGWAQISSTRWALQFYGSMADVGYYSILSQVGYVPIQTLMGVFMAFLTPIIYSMAGDARDGSRRENVNRLTNWICLLGIMITALATLFSFFFNEQILSIFVAREYLVISKYLPVMVAAGGILGVALVVAAKHLSFLSSKQLIPASIGSAIIGVIAAFVGVYLYSFTGAVFAMLLHSVSYLFMLLMVSSAMAAKDETN